MKKFIYGLATLLGVFLAAGVACAAVTIPFTVNLSEAVVVTGNPQIAVDVGGVTRYAVYSAGTGTSALTFTLSPQAGDVDLDGVTVSSPIQLNGGTITDLAGNNATLTFTPPNTSGIKIDYPSLKLDFVNNDYVLSGTHYASLPGFLTAASGTFSRASVGTYFDSSGTLQTATSGTPRFDYDPVTHVAKGILIEESRVNVLKYSGQLTGTGWNTRAGSTTAAAAVTAPDGSGTSYLETKTSGDGYVWQSVLLAPSTRYTYSIFVKGAGSNSTIQFHAWDSVVSQTSTFITVLASQNWTRVSFSFTTAATVVSGDYGFFIGTNPIYVWGAQLEAGSFPSSYIPTTSASVTRAADVLTIPVGGWFSGTAGTVVSTALIPSVGGTGLPGEVTLGSGSMNNALYLYMLDSGSDQKSMGVYTGGVQQAAAYLTPAYSAGNILKHALAYEANNINSSADGALGTLDTVSTLPSVTQMLVGATYSASLNGYAQNIRYYPSRISDMQLQLLTQ